VTADAAPGGAAWSRFDQVRLHIVTGKGGTGKTTVAAALALGLAAGGRRVLLTEVEGRQGIAQLFDTPPLPYEERRVAVAAGHGEVRALAIDPEAALLEYLDMFYNLRRAGGALRRFGAVDFATTIAPGMRDVLLTGKVKEAVIRRDHGHPAYDAVVLDAPPTGRIGRFLNVSAEVAGLAKVGPIKSQADGVMRVLRSAETAIHLVTLLEEMPVQETVDGVRELRAAELPVGCVVVNMVRAEAPAAAPSKKEVAAGLRSAGIEPAAALVTGLLAEAADHELRIALERTERAVLAELGQPMVELALLPYAVDLGALYRLAADLGAQGLGQPLGAEPA
jgi:anion-transporting  ArsA/GET3 family ATPase